MTRSLVAAAAALALAAGLAAPDAVAAPAGKPTLVRPMRIVETAGVRRGPEPGAPLAGLARTGQVYVARSVADGSFEADYDGFPGWFPSGDASADPDATTVLVTEPATVRTGPGTAFAVDGEALPGQRYGFAGQNGSWIGIDWRGGTGWLTAGAATVMTGTGTARFAPADFRVTAVAPMAAVVGTPVTLTISVTNTNAGAATPATQIQVILDPCVDGGSALPTPCGQPIRVLGVVNLASIPAGGSTQVQFAYTPVAGDAGTWDIWTWVDNGGPNSNVFTFTPFTVTGVVPPPPGGGGPPKTGTNGSKGILRRCFDKHCFAGSAPGAGALLPSALAAAGALLALARRRPRR